MKLVYKNMELNLLGTAVIIISVGLIFSGRWIKAEMLPKAVLAQVIAVACIVVVGFLIK